MLSQKASLNKFRKIEITSNIFSSHHGMKLEISNKRKNKKFTNAWKLHNTLEQSVKEVKKEISMYFEIKENENNISNLMGCSKNSVKKEVYSGKRLH